MTSSKNLQRFPVGSIKDTSRSYTVTGLSNITTIDPFEQLQIETSNTDGVEHITLHPEKTFTDLGIQYSYTVDSSSLITVSISYDLQKLIKQGYRILNNQTSKEISYQHSSTMNVMNTNVPYKEILNTFIPSVEKELASCPSYTFGKEEMASTSIFSPDRWCERCLARQMQFKMPIWVCFWI